MAAKGIAPAVVEANDDLPQIPMAEIEKHNSAKDCWLIINDLVYDITDFLEDHPGGRKAPLLYAGKDATEEFDMLHKPEVLTKYGKPFLKGRVLKGKL